MKPEIKELRKAQRVLHNLQYPGYPFQKSIIIDLEANEAWVDFCGKKQTLKQALLEISPSLLYGVIGCSKMVKGTWLIEQNLGSLDTILNADYDDFYVDDILIAKFYCALMNLIYTQKKNDRVYLFACVDEETDWVEAKCFTNMEEIKQYIKDYFTVKEN